MNDRDYIRKAVELADGFECWDDVDANCLYIESDGRTFSFRTQLILDALAAQLVRQLDVVGRLYVEADKWSTRVMKLVPLKSDCEILMSEGDDRTMNTIKAIVDSDVLAKSLSDQEERDG